MAKLDRRSVAALPGPDGGRFDVVHWDDDLPGFGLRVLSSGARSWVVRYRIGTRQRNVSLGKASALPPAKAREEAARILARTKLGQDTRVEIEARRAVASAPKERTLGDVVELYARHGIAGQKARTQVETRRYLEKHWAPLHRLPFARVGRREVAARLLELRDASGAVAANRARSALSALYAWAIQQGMADQNPVVGTRKNAEASRERTLRPEEMKALWDATAGPGDHAAIVRLLLLAGQRREEVAAMRWGEVDLERGVWTLPAARTKNGRAHEVPLSLQAQALLESLPRPEGRDLVFGRGGGPFSGWSQSKRRLDAKVGFTGWTLHDLRRTVVTGMAEMGVQPHVVEAVVNHVGGHNKVGVAGVYNRATYAGEKRAALQAWADCLDGVVAGASPRVVVLEGCRAGGEGRRQP
ncbi:MAG: tyrosine-type recombinase/integrase [Geminicoccaceae bacterium]|nr:tyrosine-type recombinase/integrase [Geminicoccaceae bacterium]